MTGSPDQYSSIIPQPHKVFPVGFGAMQIDDGAMTSGFLGLFGRPSRDSPYECARSNRTSMPQELYLFNDESLMDKIARGQRLSRWQAEKKSNAEVVENLYLSAVPLSDRGREAGGDRVHGKGPSAPSRGTPGSDLVGAEHAGIPVQPLIMP